MSEVARITITRWLDEDGEDGVTVDASERLTLLDALGMLPTFAAFALHSDLTA